MMMTLIGVLLLLTSLVIIGSEAQLEGESCVAPNGRQGICISIRDCPPLLALLPLINSGAIPFAELRRAICLLGREPLVCCGAPTVPINPPISSSPSTPQDARTGVSLLPSQCGRKGITDRIIAGQPAPLGAWPWMVVLRGKVDGRSLWFCGGTLISDRYVVTAAHCLSEKTGIELEFARIGEHNIRNNPDCTPFGDCAPQPQDITVEQIIRHPSYNSPCNECNDIALLRLSTPVTLDRRYVVPICLPINPLQDMGFTVQEFKGKAAWAAGWGTISQNPRMVVRPDILQQVQLPIEDLQYCDILKRSYPDNSMVMCAGGDGRDTCRGDSGGPLTLSDNFGSKYFLIGVTSKGPAVCGAQTTQGLYTSVHHYLPWITNNLRP